MPARRLRLQVQIDDGELMSLQYTVCLQTRCEVQMDLTKELLEKMRSGKQILSSLL
jgi:invasion protein IalB